MTQQITQYLCRPPHRIWHRNTLQSHSSPHASTLAADPLQLEFRQFVLLPGKRLLLKEGRKVDIGSRAFDLLTLLVQSRGSIVAKDRIVSTVWPTTTVEESNLRLQVTAVRRVLGEDRDLIKTVPGRGYLFVAEQLEYITRLPAAKPSVEGDGKNEAGLREFLAALTGRSGDEPDDFTMPSSPDACEMLRALLHSALDRMWEGMLQRDAAHSQVSPA